MEKKEERDGKSKRDHLGFEEELKTWKCFQAD